FNRLQTAGNGEPRFHQFLANAPQLLDVFVIQIFVFALKAEVDSSHQQRKDKDDQHQKYHSIRANLIEALGGGHQLVNRVNLLIQHEILLQTAAAGITRRLSYLKELCVVMPLPVGTKPSYIPRPKHLFSKQM